MLLSEPLPGTVGEIERIVREHGLEGIVAKRRGSIYRPGQRSDDWVKVKLSPRLSASSPPTQRAWVVSLSLSRTGVYSRCLDGTGLT